MHETIILLDDVNLIRHNLEKVRRVAGEGEYPVVPLSDAVFLFLKDKGLHCINYHQFENKDMYHDVYRTAREWGYKWYRPRDQGLTDVDSFELGNLIEWSMIYFYSHILRLFISMSAIIENVKPGKIILFTAEGNSTAYNELKLANADVSMLPYILEVCLKHLGFSVEVAIVKLSYPLSGERKLNFKALTRSLSYYLNYVLSGICKLYNIFQGKRKKILFFDGFDHFYGTMKSSRLQAFDKIHLQKRIGPLLLWNLYTNGIRVVNLFGKDRKSDLVSAPVYDLVYIKSELSDFFVYRNVNILNCIWPRLELLLKEYLPRTVFRDLKKMIIVVKKTLPACIVTENDTTYYDRILVLVAKKFKISTFVVQHGGILHSDIHKYSGRVVHGVYPLISDYCFVFGEIDRDFYKNMNVDSRKVIMTGAARFDSYYDNRKRISYSSKRDKTVLIILQDQWFPEGVITTHIGLCVLHDHINRFIALAKRKPDIQFIIRPHGNNHLWAELFRKELDSLGNLTISREESLENIFLRVDLSIGYFSTVLLESLIHRIPVITLDTGGFTNYGSLWKYGLSKRVNSFEDCEMEMEKLLYNTQERAEAIRAMERNMHLFNYGDDCKASIRIAQELDNRVSGNSR